MRVSLNKDRVYSLYHRDNLTIVEIAKKLYCSPGRLLRFMKLHDIPRRPVGGYRRSSKTHGRNWKGYGEISGAYWHVVIRRAKYRNIEISVTLDYIWQLFIKQERKCALTGIPICFTHTYAGKEKTKQTASLDRIDLSKGYVIGNVRWVHKHVNTLKNTFDDEYLHNICNLIINIPRSDNKKKVLVLGGTGFLGKALCSIIDNTKYKICSVGSQQYNLMIRDHVTCLYKLEKPDIIINLAAKVGGIGANKNSPGQFFHDNMLMNLNIIDEARKIKLEKFIQIGTTCSYGKNCQIPFREEALFSEYPEPTNAPYGIAKLSTLVMLQAYKQQYGLHGIYLIPTNLIGPNDNFHPKTSHVVPAIILKVQKGKEDELDSITLFGTGTPTRDFLYVFDCAEAICLAMERYNNIEPVNIGSGNEITISEVANKICQLMDYKGTIIWDTSKPDGQPRRCLDTSKAAQEFAFKATTSLEEGLRNTIDWFYHGDTHAHAIASFGG
jgi:GDP-L-fucose synthase